MKNQPQNEGSTTTKNNGRNSNNTEPKIAPNYPDYDCWYADTEKYEAAEAKYWRRQSVIGGISVAISFFTFIAAIVAGVIAYKAYIASTNAVTEAKRQADEARRQADAAEQQISVVKDTEHRQLRAYVGIGGLSTLQEPKGVALKIANHGQTPATDVKVFGNWEDFPAEEGIPAAFDFAENEQCPKGSGLGQSNSAPGTAVLYPNEPINSVVQQPLLCPAQAKKIIDAIAAKRIVILYGHIEYRDIFDDTHSTTFCVTWATGGSSLCDRHNEIDPKQ